MFEDNRRIRMQDRRYGTMKDEAIMKGIIASLAAEKLISPLEKAKLLSAIREEENLSLIHI